MKVKFLKEIKLNKMKNITLMKSKSNILQEYKFMEVKTKYLITFVLIIIIFLFFLLIRFLITLDSKEYQQFS